MADHPEVDTLLESGVEGKVSVAAVNDRGNAVVTEVEFLID